MTKKIKNKNLNMFVRNNGKNDHVHALYALLYVAKKEKKAHKVTLLTGPKRKIIKLCLDGPAK
jgi:ribonuclease P protein component